MKHVLLISLAYTTWWQQQAAHKTPYLNMGDAEEALEAVHPNQGAAKFSTALDQIRRNQQAKPRRPMAEMASTLRALQDRLRT